MPGGFGPIWPKIGTKCCGAYCTHFHFHFPSLQSPIPAGGRSGTSLVPGAMRCALHIPVLAYAPSRSIDPKQKGTYQFWHHIEKGPRTVHVRKRTNMTDCNYLSTALTHSSALGDVVVFFLWDLFSAAHVYGNVLEHGPAAIRKWRKQKLQRAHKSDTSITHKSHHCTLQALQSSTPQAQERQNERVQQIYAGALPSCWPPPPPQEKRPVSLTESV